MSAGTHWIAGRWTDGTGPTFVSTDPASGAAVWQGSGAAAAEVEAAVAAARGAFEAWADLGVAERIRYLDAFGEELARRRPQLAEIISRETGKPLWESLTEVGTIAGKLAISVKAQNELCGPVFGEAAGVASAVRFKPHGVVGVFGPFNLPGHLSHSHIIPALLAGNTVVWKPSEQAPLVGQVLTEIWQAAGLPSGVLNLLQGGRETGEALVAQAAQPGSRGLDGIFFTGSVPTGVAIQRALCARPEKILALELGGNNPLVVWDVADLEAAALATVQSAFITAGQRCTCARRLILPEGGAGESFLERLLSALERVRVGVWTDRPEPFLGPVISERAAGELLRAQQELLAAGATALRPLRADPKVPALLSPGVLDVTAVSDRPDRELFGPLLQVIRVPDFDAALREANRTEYGLAAGLLSDDRGLYELFLRRVRAGIVNWNRQTTGASGYLPFGGVGISGNHRPSGFDAARYCSYPVASLEQETPTLPADLPPGLR